jgi:hypothetical protein
MVLLCKGEICQKEQEKDDEKEKEIMGFVCGDVDMDEGCRREIEIAVWRFKLKKKNLIVLNWIVLEGVLAFYVYESIYVNLPLDF